MDRKIYRNTVEFSVKGRYAMFSDPITKVGSEKCSYMVPTYEALKGICHSIYWKPTIVWVVDSVRIMNKIKTARKGLRLLKYDKEEGGLSYYTYLEDVHYQVRAHFEWNLNRPELECDRNENKHHNIAKRMIERGGRRDCFLGCRECCAEVEPCVFGEGKGYYDAQGEMPLNFSYHGITYSDEAESPEDAGKLTVRFWQPVMNDGVIDFIRPSECTVKRHIKEMPIKPFGKEHNNFIGLDEFDGGDSDGLD